MSEGWIVNIFTLFSSEPLRQSVSGRISRIIDAIDYARKAGFSWSEIAEKLASVGIVRRDGKPLTSSSLSLTVRRIKARQQKRIMPPSGQNRTVSPTLLPPARAAPVPLPSSAPGDVFDEIDAMFAEPGKSQSQSLDDFLKEIKSGK